MKKQIILIHGGETFDRYEDYLDSLSRTPFDPFEKKEKFWKDNFSEDLGEGYEVFTPKMPRVLSGKKDQWMLEDLNFRKIWNFSKNSVSKYFSIIARTIRLCFSLIWKNMPLLFQVQRA
jgi:hypothetical protein